MASLSNDQIVEILSLTNGNTKMLTDAGVPTGQIIRALVGSPELVSKLRKTATAATAGYGKFYRNKVYDPTWAMNGVESKWASASPKQAKFALDFWKKVKEQGIDQTTFDAIKANLNENKDVHIQQYGIDENEYDDMMAAFDAEFEDFRESEKNRLRKQHAAYKSQQKELGIVPDQFDGAGGVDYRTQAKSQYLTAKTGIVGLYDIPTSIDDYAAKELDAFKSFAKKKGLDTGRIDQLAPQLTDVIKKKVGKNYQNYALQDLLKRQVTGQ